MTAVLSLVVDAQNQNSLDALEHSLSDAEKSTTELTQSSKRLEHTMKDVTAQEERAIIVYKEQEPLVGELITETERLGRASLNLTETLIKVELAYKAVNAVMAPVRKSIELVGKGQEQLNFVYAQAEKLLIRKTAALAGYGAAANTAIPIITGMTLALTGYKTVLDATGVKEVNGERVSNWTRERDAVAGLLGDVKMLANEGFGVLAEKAKETFNNLMLVKLATAAWKEFDASVTRTTDQTIENIRLLREGITGIPVAMQEATRRLEEANERNRESFANLRGANQGVIKSADDRAEAERIAGLKTQSAINGEIDALKRSAGEMAFNSEFGQEQLEAYTAKYEALVRRREQLIEQENQKHREAAARMRQYYIDSYKETEEFRESEYVRGVQAIDAKREEESRKATEAAERVKREAQQAENDRLQFFIESYRKDNDARKRAALEAIQTEKARLEGLKALTAAQGGPSGEQLLMGADRGAVLKRIQQQRAAAARAAFTASDQYDMSDPTAQRRHDVNLRRVGQEAERRAFQDFQGNRIGVGEYTQAAGQVATEQLRTMQGQGKLSQDFVRLSIENLNTAKQLAVEQDAIRQEVESLRKENQQVQQSTGRRRDRATAMGFVR